MWGTIFFALMLAGVFAKEKTWTHRLAVSVDLLSCSIVWLKYDVTISSWCEIEYLKGAHANKFALALRWCLNHIQTDHCALALEADVERAEAAIAYLVAGQLTQRLAQWEASLKK